MSRSFADWSRGRIADFLKTRSDLKAMFAADISGRESADFAASEKFAPLLRSNEKTRQKMAENNAQTIAQLKKMSVKQIAAYVDSTDKIAHVTMLAQLLTEVTDAGQRDSILDKLAKKLGVPSDDAFINDFSDIIDDLTKQRDVVGAIKELSEQSKVSDARMRAVLEVILQGVSEGGSEDAPFKSSGSTIMDSIKRALDGKNEDKTHGGDDTGDTGNQNPDTGDLSSIKIKPAPRGSNPSNTDLVSTASGNMIGKVAVDIRGARGERFKVIFGDQSAVLSATAMKFLASRDGNEYKDMKLSSSDYADVNKLWLALHDNPKNPKKSFRSNKYKFVQTKLSSASADIPDTADVQGSGIRGITDGAAPPPFIGGAVGKAKAPKAAKVPKADAANADNIKTPAQPLKPPVKRVAGTGVPANHVTRTRKRLPSKHGYLVNQKTGVFALDPKVTIDIPTLFNKMKLKVTVDGVRVIHNKPVDQSLIELITKRFNPSASYSAEGKAAFAELVQKARTSTMTTSGKYKFVIAAEPLLSPSQMVKRLAILVGEKKAGNTNELLVNEAKHLITMLRKAEHITADAAAMLLKVTS